MTSSLVKSKQIIGAHFSTLFSAVFLPLMFLNIHIDWIILKTYDQQFTLTTKKSLHIIFKVDDADKEKEAAVLNHKPTRVL